MAARRPTPRQRRKGTASTSVYLDWIEHLADASKTRTVIVAHKRDADVLKSLGVRNVYYPIEPYFRFLDSIIKIKRECILLFDATRPGNSVSERVGSDLNQHGIKTNTRFRKLLFTSANKELGGLLKFIHQQVMGAERKHAAGPAHGL